MPAFFCFESYQMTFNEIVDCGSGKTWGINGNVVYKVLVQEVIATAVAIIQCAISELVYIDNLRGLAVLSQAKDAFICVTVDRTLFYPSFTVATMVFLGGVVGWF